MATNDPQVTDPQVAETEKLKESIAKLEANNRRLVEEKALAEKAAKEAKEAAERQEEATREYQAAAQRQQEDAAKKAGDIEALEKSWHERLEKETGELRTQLEARRATIHALTVGATAHKLASELARPGSAEVLLPHVKARLSVAERDGVPVVQVVDADGKPTASTLDDLAQEFRDHLPFAPIILDSQASGTGAGPSGGSGGSGKKFDEMNPAELAKLRRTDPEQYERLARAAGKRR